MQRTLLKNHMHKCTHAYTDTVTDTHAHTHSVNMSQTHRWATELQAQPQLLTTIKELGLAPSADGKTTVARTCVGIRWRVRQHKNTAYSLVHHVSKTHSWSIEANRQHPVLSSDLKTTTTTKNLSYVCLSDSSECAVEFSHACVWYVRMRLNKLAQAFLAFLLSLVLVVVQTSGGSPFLFFWQWLSETFTGLHSGIHK